MLTLLILSKLRLKFMIRCRSLKRPPMSLRVKANKLYMKKQSYTQIASLAETSILEKEIMEKKKYLRELTKARNLSDPKLLEPVNEVKVRTIQGNLAKKHNQLLEESKTKWLDWPLKSPNKSHSSNQSNPNSPNLPQKRMKNRKKREREDP